jgi:phosphoribosylformylglycinamidine cyclo-ligase
MNYDTTKQYKHQLRKLIEMTWANCPHSIAIAPGLYPSFRRNHTDWEVDHTDGIGTKGQLHWRQGTFAAAAQDALAMNLNDLAMVGANAYKLQCHLMLPEDNHDVVIQIMNHLVAACCHRHIAITGGETSVHDNLAGLEISLTVTGIVVDHLTGKIEAGDRLIYLPAQGIHANGLTWVRQLMVCGALPFADWMVEPTPIYADRFLGRQLPIKAAMHITGGAFTKLFDILPDRLDIDFQALPAERVPTIFFTLKDLLGFDSSRMYSTFNCGVGMILVTAAADADRVAAAVGGIVNGRVMVGNGRVRVGSTFDPGNTVIYYTSRDGGGNVS